MRLISGCGRAATRRARWRCGAIQCGGCGRPSELLAHPGKVPPAQKVAIPPRAPLPDVSSSGRTAAVSSSVIICAERALCFSARQASWLPPPVDLAPILPAPSPARAPRPPSARAHPRAMPRPPPEPAVEPGLVAERGQPPPQPRSRRSRRPRRIGQPPSCRPPRRRPAAPGQRHLDIVERPPPVSWKCPEVTPAPLRTAATSRHRLGRPRVSASEIVAAHGVFSPPTTARRHYCHRASTAQET